MHVETNIAQPPVVADVGASNSDCIRNNNSNSNDNDNKMSFDTVVDEDFLNDCFRDFDNDDFENDDLDSLNVDTCSITSSPPATPAADVSNILGSITKQQDLSPPSSINMESADERMQKSLYDIPHIVTLKLIRSLDTDVGWEKLAAASGFNFEEIGTLRSEQRKSDGSPTRSLLWKLGCQAYTLQMLHDKLKELNRIYDAEIVATYIMEGDRRTRPPPVFHASPSKNSDSLSSYLSQISISNHQPTMGGAASYYQSPTGSEVNFNNQYVAGTTPMKLAAGNKSIPGAKVSPMSYIKYGSVAPSFASHNPCSIPPSSSSDNNRQQQPFMGGGDPPPSFSACMAGSGYTKQESSTRILREVGISPSLLQNNSLLPSQAPSEAKVAMSVKTAFSYQELAQATDGFNESKILGEGGFGVVYHGQLRTLDCAVKKFVQRRSEERKDSTEQINSELSALLRYQHENIVTLYGYALDGPHLCLVYQYLRNGSLEDRLMKKNNSPSLSWERRLNILVGSCKAVHFLHTMGSTPLIHGDIKSANILLDNHMEAKFADLGQSRYATSSSSTMTGNLLTHITIAQSTSKQYGSQAYLAPEIKSGCRISIQSDMYAMGVVFLEVCSGLMACNFDRNENKFLTDLYTHHFAKRGEAVLLQEFQDRTPTDRIHPSAFMATLKQASQCIMELKKARPNSKKLLIKTQNIYDGQYKEQSFPKSLNSPTEDDVTDTSSPPYAHSHHRSGGERPVSNENNSYVPHTTHPSHYSPSPPSPLSSSSSHSHQPQKQMPSILRLQEERLQQISIQNSQQTPQSPQQRRMSPSFQHYSPTTDSSTFKNTHPPIPHPDANPNPMPQSMTPSGVSHLSYHHQSSVPACLPNQSALLPSQQSPGSSYHRSFSQGNPQPEAYMLQRHYDERLASGQLIDQNKVVTSDANPNLSYTQTQNSTAPSPLTRNPVEQGESVEQTGEDSALASDPSKLARMKMFDELSFRSINTNNINNPVDISSPVSMKCDEAKLAYLNNFDDRVFHAKKATAGRDGNDEVGSNSKAGGSPSNCDSHSSSGVGGTDSGDQHNACVANCDVELGEDNLVRSNSETNPKVIEAMNPPNNRCSPPPSPSQQARMDSSYYGSSGGSSGSSKGNSVSTVVNTGLSNGYNNDKKGDSGNVPDQSHQQRMAKRENLFLNYNAGKDENGDDIDDGDEEGDEEYEEEAREEKYV